MKTAKRVPLSELVCHMRTTVKPTEIEPQRQYILLEHISAGTGEVFPVSAGEHNIRSAKKFFEAGDVLYGKLRPKLRKVCVATSSGYCSTDILSLRPVYSHSSYFLATVLRSERFYLEVERLVGGANLPRVNAKELLDLEVPWPNESELMRLNEVAKISCELRSEVSFLDKQLQFLESAIWAN